MFQYFVGSPTEIRDSTCESVFPMPHKANKCNIIIGRCAQVTCFSNPADDCSTGLVFSILLVLQGSLGHEFCRLAVRFAG